MSAKEFKDVFDNEICYYILMAESYYNMLIENSANFPVAPAPMGKDNPCDDSIKRFYYIEASYYFNKAIMLLRPIYNIASDVLSQKVNGVYQDKKIAIARYENACQMLKCIYDYLNDNKDIVSGLDHSDTIIEVNNKYMENLTHTDFFVHH